MTLFGKSPLPPRDRPPLDLEQPTDLRTATFALG
jgi:hypothetical protein